MTGTRKPDNTPLLELEPGDYSLRDRPDRPRAWIFCAPTSPSGEVELLGDLRTHEVVEHEDGTITVSPSILVGGAEAGQTWHGYLERGVWREC